ncbi:hypothetical protein BHE74_00037056 [Ensete ventricosum]|nr:hypothetical protein BHE74_00037056 [Ensete ventricosum]
MSRAGRPSCGSSLFSLLSSRERDPRLSPIIREVEPQGVKHKALEKQFWPTHPVQGTHFGGMVDTPPKHVRRAPPTCEPDEGVGPKGPLTAWI